MSIIYDCIIIGGGPAGLTAAFNLTRLRRRILLFDHGQSRARFIPITHNYPGFPDGISGKELLKLLNKQAEKFNVEIVHEEVIKIVQEGSYCLIYTSRDVYQSRSIILATGISDLIPDVAGTEQLLRDGLLRLCPICDAFEAIDKKIAVIGHSLHTLKEARFLRRFSKKVSLLSNGNTFMPKNNQTIPIYTSSIATFTCLEDELLARFHDGNEERFDRVYAALGVKINNQAFSDWSIRKDKTGQIYTDKHQRTNLEKVYAIGDLVSGLNQLSICLGQATVAAVAIHNQLRGKK